MLPIDKQPALRITTRPNDANPDGDIFGGWLMSQIDIAGAIAAVRRSHGPVVTRAVKDLQFIEPLYVHDLVSFYSEVIHVGTTSITVAIEVFAQRLKDYGVIHKIADATYVYVAVTHPGEKRQVPPL
jgi:acyl-CoA thioesterase YciA